MPDIVPGKEEEFRYFQRWLAASDRLDRAMERAETVSAPSPLRRPDPQPAPALAARPRGLRAGFASRLARLALALHPEAAAGAVLQPGPDRPR